MDITQSIIWPPLIDGIILKLTCIAERKYEFIEFVTIKWTGEGLEKSIWVKQSGIKKQKDSFKIDLLFMPWLDSHAGEYTCHVEMKDINSSTITLTEKKVIEVKGTYVHT